MNSMYVINQKSSHFQNGLPNGPLYYSDSQIQPGNHLHGEQLSSMMNNQYPRFMNPQNGNSIRQHSVMTSPMMPHGNKTQKTAMNNCATTDDISMSYQATDNFPSMNTSYKSRNSSLDPVQSIVNTQNATNLTTDMINTGTNPADSSLSLHSTSTNRTQTPRNKRPRAVTSRSRTPNIKEPINGHAIMTPLHTTTVIRPSLTNANVMPIPVAAGPHHKCLPQTQNVSMPYNMVDIIPQQLKPRMPLNVINSYGCNRSQIMDKNMPMFSPANHPLPLFNQSAHNVPPFFPHVDNGLPLPMFHLHSRLPKLSECDRLTFPVNHGNLWGPLTLRHGDQVTEVQFELNQDNLQQIVNRSDLDIIVTSFTHRDQFRLCHWPEFLELRINGNLLSLDNTLLQDLKVHMPCCIKRFCRLGTNILQFTVSKCVCCHLFQTYMVHRPTLSHAIETILNKCTSPISTRTLLSDFYSKVSLTSNTDDGNSICVVSLICPMSQTRITIPARTKCCKHIQPFDLLEFLKVQTKWPQYFCPICRVKVTFNLNEYIQNVVVDEVIKEILSLTDASVRRVILYPDGKWKPISDMKLGSAQIFQDAYNQEPLVTVMRQSALSSRSYIASPQLSLQQRPNLCNEAVQDKKPNSIHQSSELDFYSPDMKNTICSSTMPSPALSRSHFSAGTGDSHSRTNTPSLGMAMEPSPQKRSRRSPFANIGAVTFPTLSSDSEQKVTQSSETVNMNSPESIKTPISSASESPCVIFSSCIAVAKPSPIYMAPFMNNPDASISSTTGLSSAMSTRTTTVLNGDNTNKQTSSGSSNPSSPPEFFDPHSTTTNYEDDDNSSLHLQRLIGFIDEILSEEEEYVLDTQWASFTWPSADKSLDLLHLSDIEKLL